MSTPEEDKRGNAIARSVWDWLQQAKAVELVPWVCNPNSDTYDAMKVAEHRGWRRAIQELEELIMTMSDSENMEEATRQ